jgi:hypothetical protein
MTDAETDEGAPGIEAQAAKPGRGKPGKVVLADLREGETVVGKAVIWPNCQKIKPNITLRDCVHLPGSNTVHPGYVHQGHEPGDYNLKVLGGEFKNFGGGTLETKALDGLFEGVKGAWRLRVRHGRGIVVRRCPGLVEATVRGHDHTFEDVPRAVLKLWVGNLEAEYKLWSEQHIKGGGHNMQRSRRITVLGAAREVIVGWGAPDRLKSTDHKIAAALRSKTSFRVGHSPGADVTWIGGTGSGEPEPQATARVEGA